MPLIPGAPVHAHRLRYRVAYGETDAMGRVYYAHYLVWFERGRTELLREMGFAYREMEAGDLLLPVRRCEVRYAGYAAYDDEVEIVTWVGDVSRASLTFLSNIEVVGGSRPVVHGVVELACVNRAGRIQPLPAELAAAIKACPGSGDIPPSA